MEYKSTVEFTTEVAPGAVFHLRKMSHGRRIELNRMTAAIQQKISEVEAEMQAVDAEISRSEEAAKIEPCTCNHGPVVVPLNIPEDALDPTTKHSKTTGRCPHAGCHCREAKPDLTIGDYSKLFRLSEKRNTIIIDEMYPHYIKWGVESVEGLTIDGVPATVEDILAKGAEPIVGALGKRIHEVIRMSPEQVLGFKSPSTSGAQTDGQMNGTSAPSANDPVSIRTGTVVDTSRT